MGITSRFARALMCVSALIYLYASSAAQAEEAPPAVLQTDGQMPLQKVGSGTYHKFGFAIYHATLWAPNGKWDASKPYALELRYARSLSKETLADETLDNIRDENIADDATLERWSANIKNAMPAVEDGDVMVGASIPGSETVLYLNGNQIAKIKDQELSRAFFNIWLGEDADDDLKKELLAQAE